MKKYYIIGSFLIAIAAIYILLIGNIDGNYRCVAYDMLDDGYSESFLKFKNNIISHVFIEPGKPPITKAIGTYKKVEYSTVIVDDNKLGFSYVLDSRMLGLYMRDADAAKLGVKFPKIGNIWCWRKLW